MKKKSVIFMGIRTIEVTLFCVKRYMLRHSVYDAYFGNGIMIKSIIMKVDREKDLCY